MPIESYSWSDQKKTSPSSRTASPTGDANHIQVPKYLNPKGNIFWPNKLWDLVFNNIEPTQAFSGDVVLTCFYLDDPKLQKAKERTHEKV
ncbi:uncharacterized protein EAF01_000063 [Botrytis porri]|uniref:Uncharacterized protein n=1 Tax=Botrytis porri TaxID=87229 RepID=A0A4Z1L4D9_9HELO|nr:uncharacterized protein EAF01_000063 [Botrytis porri]KAF7913657.1 hypothetical protein EAF01_000063 [Botrytis porri]TGO91700.1 hypothetical protein BPOR_0021g00450 [Botrytis porri]